MQKKDISTERVAARERGPHNSAVPNRVRFLSADPVYVYDQYAEAGKSRYRRASDNDARWLRRHIGYLVAEGTDPSGASLAEALEHGSQQGADEAERPHDYWYTVVSSLRGLVADGEGYIAQCAEADADMARRRKAAAEAGARTSDAWARYADRLAAHGVTGRMEKRHQGYDVWVPTELVLGEDAVKALLEKLEGQA